MDRADESSMSRQSLPASVVGKIFQTMQGNYGSRFLNQWRTGQILENGKDAGLVNAMAFWGSKLGRFACTLERIEHALKHLPEDPPSLPVFERMCNSAPAKEAPALRYVPTAEDEERARQAAASAAKAIKKISGDGIDTHWATHPKSVQQLKFIFEAAQRDKRFAPCIDQMVQEGICTEDGYLLKTYRDQQWWPVVRRAA